MEDTRIACRHAVFIDVIDQQRVVERGKGFRFRGDLHRTDVIIAGIDGDRGRSRGQAEPFFDLELGAGYADDWTNKNRQRRSRRISTTAFTAIFRVVLLANSMRFCVEVRFEFYGKHGSAAQQKLLDHQIRLLRPAVERLLLELGGERSLDARAAKLIGLAALREQIERERSGKAVEEASERLKKRIAKRRIEKRLGLVEGKVQGEVVEEAARVEVLFAETLRVREEDWVKKYVEFEKGDRLEMAVLEGRFAIALLEGAGG